MPVIVSLLVCVATAGFILAPFWTRAAAQSRRAVDAETWHSLEQLELDRALGKIDDAEFEELKARIKPEAAPLPLLEGLILQFRAQQRLHTSLEAEVLIARERSKRAGRNGSHG